MIDNLRRQPPHNHTFWCSLGEDISTSSSVDHKFLLTKESWFFRLYPNNVQLTSNSSVCTTRPLNTNGANIFPLPCLIIIIKRCQNPFEVSVLPPNNAHLTFDSSGRKTKTFGPTGGKTHPLPCLKTIHFHWHNNLAVVYTFPLNFKQLTSNNSRQTIPAFGAHGDNIILSFWLWKMSEKDAGEQIKVLSSLICVQFFRLKVKRICHLGPTPKYEYLYRDR